MAFIATVGLGLTGAAALAGGIAATGVIGGIAANGVAAAKAGKAAKKMESLAGQVPQSQKSNYAGKMIGTAQNDLNAQNPFLAFQNRSIQNSQANSMANAQRNSLDPSMLLKMTEAYQSNSMAAQAQNQLSNLQMRGQKIDNMYRAYNAGMQQDQMYYDNDMTAFNSKANLQNAAAQTRINAWQNVGNGLMSVGSAALKMSSGLPSGDVGGQVGSKETVGGSSISTGTVGGVGKSNWGAGNAGMYAIK